MWTKINLKVGVVYLTAYLKVLFNCLTAFLQVNYIYSGKDMTCNILFLYNLDAELMYANLQMSPLERIS